MNLIITEKKKRVEITESLLFREELFLSGE